MTNIQSKIHIITGPTASGKSGLALQIAEKTAKENLKCVIINADSQQMIRELPILTARPSAQEESRVPHRLYGTISVAERCSAGMWLRLARMEIDWALSQGVTPIVVGGAGLYINALMQGIAEIPDIDPQVRLQAASDYEQMGKEAFAERLRYVDPEFFTRLKVYDKQRLIRAYEVWLGSGKSLSFWQAQALTPPYPAESFHLQVVELPRDELYRRCDERFVKMVEQGAVEEVQMLRNSGFGDKGLGVIGVKELSAYLDGTVSLEQAIKKSQQATRNYAKRQMTWFRTQLA